MAKAKIAAATKKPELPGMTGKGVEPMKIPALDKLISIYEKHKAARCAESPGELAAKKELKFALQQHKNSLVTKDGVCFYRSAEFERDYILEEKLTVRKFADEEEGDI